MNRGAQLSAAHRRGEPELAAGCGGSSHCDEGEKGEQSCGEEGSREGGKVGREDPEKREGKRKQVLELYERTPGLRVHARVQVRLVRWLFRPVFKSGDIGSLPNTFAPHSNSQI